ncbi:MAG TPA: 5'-3' exonuclease H3TH domain-containing protein [Armatimonadota bacterium]
MGGKLLLIDGHNLLFRTFYGIPARIPGRDGQAIHGVVGFVGTLLRTLALLEPTHLLVVFDHESGSFRNTLDENYKSNRVAAQAERDDPFSQLPAIYHTLDHLGWQHSETPGVEADDVIAAYAQRYGGAAEVVILSTDADLLQLIGPGVSVLYPRGKASLLYGPAEVVAKYGVAPCFIPDLKALTGDQSDNLVGVPGIGPKTACALIQRFGGIAEIFQQLEAIERDLLRQKLMAHQQQVLHNLALMRLDRQVTLPCALAELAIVPESWQRKTMGLLREAGIAGFPEDTVNAGGLMKA